MRELAGKETHKPSCFSIQENQGNTCSWQDVAAVDAGDEAGGGASGSLRSRLLVGGCARLLGAARAAPVNMPASERVRMGRTRPWK